MKNLIPLSYLNEACFLSSNVDEKKYKIVLKMSQERLEDILGVSFYEQIETQYPNDLTDDNLALYDYIKDYLAWQTYFYFLKFANVESTPTGIRQFNDDNSEIINDVKMFSLEKNVLERANNYRFRMINFLKLEKEKDSTKYPLWKDLCKDEMSFAISSIGGRNNTIVRVNKAVSTNDT